MSKELNSFNEQIEKIVYNFSYQFSFDRVSYLAKQQAYLNKLLIMVYTVLNKQDFERELEDAADKLVIIDFYANWSGPCKIVEPLLQELAFQFVDKARFLKVNVEDCEDIAMAYNVTCMPTFVFIKDRQVIDVLLGGDTEKLVKNIRIHMEAGRPTVKEFKDDNNADSESGSQNVLEHVWQENSATGFEAILND